ncbi:MAG TPA: hypothetical protein VG322_08650 [Candidatus Acidoferrales bacterium]|nr:hypothetical protein [Candidatus Acidoferrales bacterium]
MPEQNSNQVELELFKSNLGSMSDNELLRLGDSLAKMCAPGATGGLAVKEISEIHLEEVKAEWKKRHPSTDT